MVKLQIYLLLWYVHEPRRDPCIQSPQNLAPYWFSIPLVNETDNLVVGIELNGDNRVKDLCMANQSERVGLFLEVDESILCGRHHSFF